MAAVHAYRSCEHLPQSVPQLRGDEVEGGVPQLRGDEGGGCTPAASTILFEALKSQTGVEDESILMAIADAMPEALWQEQIRAYEARATRPMTTVCGSYHRRATLVAWRSRQGMQGGREVLPQ